MKKKNTGDHLMSNDELFRALRSCDPAPVSSPHALLSLENSIMAQINMMPSREIENAVFLPDWFVEKPWAQQAAGFAILLIVTAGFLVGQMSYGIKTSSLSNNISLFAANGAGEHPDTLTDTLDGDDDAE